MSAGVPREVPRLLLEEVVVLEVHAVPSRRTERRSSRPPGASRLLLVSEADASTRTPEVRR